jgi:hypothetical protein
MNINETINSDLKTIARYTKQVGLQLEAAEILRGIDLSDIGYWTIYRRERSSRLHISLELSDKHKDSNIVHNIAQRLHIKFNKEKDKYAETLTYTAETDMVIIVVSGAIPKTCKIVETQVPLTADELEKARAAVPAFRMTRELRCKVTWNNE